MRHPTPITQAWVSVTLGIAAVDVALVRHHQPTLSTSIRRTLRHPRKRWPVVACWGLLTAHFLVETKFDPLGWTARYITPSVEAKL